jgi:penicillin-binding protein 2
VIVEHGGHGGSAAAPVAKAVIDQYLDGNSVAQP